ncbi:MAG: hypothetical protein CMJ64_13600 [Planctomycetaceae bacterium]|jgi:hypothetical protein|nr:hypothetical protein [Planctomycetaceae bacterium]
MQFDIQSEAAKDRDRYGRNTLGQSLLLARRLVEIKVPVVQCNMGIVQSWDTHTDNFPRLKDRLLPQVDRGVSALLDDLLDRALLERTLVIVVGEFGRSAKLSMMPGASKPGRGHWAWGYTAVFAGAGVEGGQVIGKTDHTRRPPRTSHAAQPRQGDGSPVPERCCLNSRPSRSQRARPPNETRIGIIRVREMSTRAETGIRSRYPTRFCGNH